MAIMRIGIFPIGTGTTSISEHIAEAVKILKKERRVKYSLGPMGTTVEGDLDRLMGLAKKMHRTVLKGNVQRVITSLTIDERLDKELSIEGKVEAVREKL